MPKQVALTNFDLGLSFLPDETIFSWCSRYHRQSANGLDRTTCIRLFDHSYIGLSHDFPARLGALVKKSKGALGTTSDIIFDRTLLPYYFPFRPADLAEQAIAALAIGGISHLKYRLGLLTSGLGAGHPLKACPQCIQNDLDSHGWPYWRRSHQIPGTWVCSTHMVRLSRALLKNQQRARFSWILPLQADCLAPIEFCNEDFFPWLNRLTELNTELIAYPPGAFCNGSQIARTFRHRMTSLGLISESGRVYWKKIELHLCELASRLRHLPELSHQADPKLLRGQLLRLLAGRSLTHPLRYTIWISTFFAGLNEFAKTYSIVLASPLSESSDSQNIAKISKPMNESSRQVLAHVISEEISLREAANRLGVSHVTVASWAAHLNFQAKRRPKIIDHNQWDKAVEMLESGAEKSAIAEKIGISVVSVTRILRTTPALQNTWHKVRDDKRKLCARSEWKNSLPLLGSIGIVGMRTLHPAAYAWLYRNDREWLKCSVATDQSMRKENHSIQRMQNSDARLADAIREMIKTDADSRHSFDLRDIQLIFPRISQILKTPNRWPLTMQALTDALGR